MGAFPGSPRLLSGALVGVDPLNPLASIIVFQYNPETVTRTVTVRTAGQDADQSEALRLKGPPGETIAFDVELDATDQLEKADPIATTLGVAPALASLEMLLYPKSALVIANQVLMSFGVIEVIPAEAPLTLLIWGSKRVLPVRLTSFTITEQAFDPALNPIQAKVALSLQVLTYDDLGLLSIGGALSLAHQVIGETMATIAGAGAISSGISAVAESAGLSVGG
jgi:hypothetical protein